VNHDDHYSIWFADRDLPLGWREVGKSGAKSECLTYIKKVLSEMPPEKRALLERRLKQKSATGLAGDSGIPRRQDRDVAPVLHSSSMVPESRATNIFTTWLRELSGPASANKITLHDCGSPEVWNHFIDVDGVPSSVSPKPS
jgi:MbtH protein